jgi:diguanylate cyclase (GGDEF)-like protein
VRANASIGVLSPFVGGDYYGAIIAGVHAAARAAGGRIIAIQTLPPGSKSADGSGVPDFRLPVAWDHVDGLLLLPGAVSATYVSAAQDAGLPVVLIGHQIPDADCPAVLTNNRSGIAQAISHLVAHGHERIAFAGNLGGTDVRERHDAYLEAMQTHGLPVEPDLLFIALDNHEDGGLAVAQRMHAAGMSATALLLGTDRNAIGLMAGLAALGHDLPRELAVIGFDDISLGSYTEPSLSTVRQSLHGLGETSYELINRMITGSTVPGDVVRVKSEFVQRDSCGCPPTGLQVSEQQVRRQFDDNENLHLTLNTQYELAIELLRTHEQDPRALTWLDRTPATGGCLGLWRDGSADGPSPDAFAGGSMATDPATFVAATDVIDIVGAYQPDRPVVNVGEELPITAFPPAGLLSLPSPDNNEIVFIVPVSGDKRDWGVLAAIGRIQDSTPPGREMMNHSGALLAVALEHDSMLRSLHAQEERLRQTALYDHLTGLPNRSLLLDRLTQAGERARRHVDHRFAVLFVDLDDFKAVNDTYGHAAGDEVLVEVAHRLTRMLRPADTAARLGGDEFVLLLDDVSAENLPLSIVERLNAAIGAPMTIAGQTMRVQASIGAAISGGAATDAESLLRTADLAMYEKKKLSQHRGRSHNPDRASEH